MIDIEAAERTCSFHRDAVRYNTAGKTTATKATCHTSTPALNENSETASVLRESSISRRTFENPKP